MSREEILHEIGALPPADRTFILRQLCEASLTGHCGAARRQGIDETFARYRDAMLTATGVDCMERSRRQPVVWARNIIAFEMMHDGFVHTEIARRLGLSHSQLPYCRERVAGLLQAPRFYDNEITMYHQFKQAIK